MIYEAVGVFSIDPTWYIWFWLAVCVICAIIEAATTDLVSIWFSFSAIITMIISIFMTDLLLQFAIFVAFSFVMLASTRPIVKKYFKRNSIQTNVDSLIGRPAVVTIAMKQNEHGEVKVDGKYWMAVSYTDSEINEHEKVEVLAIEGVKLIVKKI